MVATICLLIPPLLLVCIRENVLKMHKDVKEGVIEYLLITLLFDGIMMFLLNFAFHFNGNLFLYINEHSRFACKYILLAVIVAIAIPWLEKLLRAFWCEVKNPTYNTKRDKHGQGAAATTDACAIPVTRQTRKSGIELLKVGGIVLIVISHVVQTWSSSNSAISYSDYIINISSACVDVQRVILSILRYSGVFGNSIFFICSAWFLLNGKKANYRKPLFMLLDVWVVSVIILGVFLAVRPYWLTPAQIRNSLLPTTFSNNWYLTCYMVFYMIHPLLNRAISSLKQKSLLRYAILLGILYIIANYITSGFFGTSVFATSNIVLWVAIYFVMAYVKKYMPSLTANIKINIGLFVIGLGGAIGMVLLTNVFLLNVDIRTTLPFLSMSLQSWNNNCSPFLLLASFALLNIANHAQFRNRFINGLSGLSLLIYIIHENLLVRTYIRPYMINYVYEHFGYDHIVAWVFALVGIIFLCAAGLAWLYRATLQRLVKFVSDRLYIVLKKAYLCVESHLISIK